MEERLFKDHAIGESPHACMGEGLTGHANGVTKRPGGLVGIGLEWCKLSLERLGLAPKKRK